MGDKAEQGRLDAIADLVFRRGGITGAVYRLVSNWPGQFSKAQISIALRGRWPVLVPNRYQVSDCLDRFERQGLIECILYKHSKIYRFKNARDKFSKPVRPQDSFRQQTIHPPRASQGWPQPESRPAALLVHRDADQTVPEDRRGNLPVFGSNPDRLEINSDPDNWYHPIR